ncbi:protein MANNAN SYNTHESIS-RELATED 2-like [Wolffia australiana]
MAVDLRQVLSAFLTLSLFGMLSNMVKHDYFDSSEEAFEAVSSVQIGVIRVEDQRTGDLRDGPWKEIGHELKPCWTKPAPFVEEPKGYVTFSLTTGPGHHELQIANAVTVARFLGATLVLPEIRGNELGESRRFGDVYDEGRFLEAMEGVVRVAAELPAEAAAQPPPVVRIPDGASEAYISAHVAPLFRRTRLVRIAVLFEKSLPIKGVDAVACLTIHAAVALSAELRRAAAGVVDELRSPGRSVEGRFVAVDLRVNQDCSGDELDKKRGCLTPSQAAALLTRAGFGRSTSLYLTQAKWQQGLESLKEIFPRTYTKEDLIDSEEIKRRIFVEGGEELGRALDSYVCTQSDVFLPAAGDVIFGGAVAGKRIAAGRTQVLPYAHVARRCHC